MRITAMTAAACAAVMAITASVRAAAPEALRSADEKAIRAVAEAFGKASNTHDAQGIAALFAPAGEIVDEEGQAVAGREAIARSFAAMFQAYPKVQVRNAAQTIRLVGPAVAIEDGTSYVTNRSAAGSQRNRYTVVYLKEEGKWQVASARDLPDEEGSGREELEQLRWLAGHWVSESPEAVVVTTYRWDEVQRALLGEFRAQVGGRPELTSVARIGWDPLARKIHAWVFDSEGGYAEGIWTRSGNHWIAKVTGTTGDGRACSSTNVITHAGKDRMTWQSHDRVVGDEVQPDIDEIVIVRKPPEAAAPASPVDHDSTGGSK